ncbi:MAG: hypothetical protein ABJB05_08375 [Parafilimonas sp.]
MKQTEKFILIKGLFSAEDATEVLLSLINYKIRFHQMKNFSLQERFGKNDKYSLERIDELKVSRERIETIIGEAKSGNADMIINSSIDISIKTLPKAKH